MKKNKNIRKKVESCVFFLIQADFYPTGFKITYLSDVDKVNQFTAVFKKSNQDLNKISADLVKQRKTDL